MDYLQFIYDGNCKSPVLKDLQKKVANLKNDEKWLESSPLLETCTPEVTEKGSLHLVLGYIGEKLNDGRGLK